jgi:hypothetical protein
MPFSSDVAATSRRLQQPLDPVSDHCDDFGDVVPGEAAGGMKADTFVAVGRKDAVEHQCMDMNVEIQRATKALNDGDRTAPAVGDAVTPRAAAQESEHRPEIHRHDRQTEIVIPGEEIAQPMRQAQDPLANRDVWKHVISCASRSGRPSLRSRSRSRSCSQRWYSRFSW